MDKTFERLIEREAAEALLDRGVSVPLLSFSLPWSKQKRPIRVTMRRPTLAGQMEIAREYLSLGVTSEEIWGFTKEQEMSFLAKHGKPLSRIMAYCICRSYWSRHLAVRLMAWLVRNFMPREYMIEAMKTFVLLMGTEAFMPIIRSAERINPTRRRLSREEKGSQRAAGTAPIAPSVSSGK